MLVKAGFLDPLGDRSRLARGDEGAAEEAPAGERGDPALTPGELVGGAGEPELCWRTCTGAGPGGGHAGADGVGDARAERPAAPAGAVPGSPPGTRDSVEREGEGAGARDAGSDGGPDRVPPAPSYEERAPGLVPAGRGRVGVVGSGTLFRSVYRRYGDLLHHGGAFLLEGRVEQSSRRGFAFLVERVEDLQERLAGSSVPAPRIVSAPGAFVRAGRQGRRAG